MTNLFLDAEIESAGNAIVERIHEKIGYGPAQTIEESPARFVQFRSDGFRVLIQNVDQSPSVIGELGIFDPQHHFDIDEKAPQIEICGTNINRIIDNHQFRVQTPGLIFEKPSVPL